jgi:uncharacterized protein YbjT (DUF2867 family)
VKLIGAAKSYGIPRYVMVSSMGANPSIEGDETFAVYLRAKGRADAALQESGLDYTIVRPTRLTDDPGNGRIQIGKGLGRGSISRDDVAAVLAAALPESATIGETFELVSGDVPVTDAVRSL